tara:strand:- start:308 stop:1843 length:1536 start_codon:yes stop_codon:yes gene_type:complete
MSEDKKQLILIECAFEPTEVEHFTESVEIVEGRKVNALLRVTGKMQHANMENANKRVYPTALWEKVLGDKSVQWRLKNKMMFGEMDHPKDGRTSLQRVSHIISKLEKGKDGAIMGEAIVLDTSHGRNLAAILSQTGMLGVSSRGFGKLKTDGKTVDESTFDFKTVDFVAEPSTPGAYVVPISEAIGYPEDSSRLSEVDAVVESIRSLVSGGDTLPETGLLDAVATLIESLCAEGETPDEREILQKVKDALPLKEEFNQPVVDNARSSEMENENVSTVLEDLQKKLSDISDDGERASALEDRLGLAEQIIDELGEINRQVKEDMFRANAAKEVAYGELEEQHEAAKKIIDEFVDRTEDSQGVSEDGANRMAAAEKIIDAQQAKIEEQQIAVEDLAARYDAAELLLQTKLDLEEEVEVSKYAKALTKGNPKQDALVEMLSECVSKEAVDQKFAQLSGLLSEQGSARFELPNIDEDLDEDDVNDDSVNEDVQGGGDVLTETKRLMGKLKDSGLK